MSKEKLVQKLPKFGLKERELSLIKTYLTNREQTTIANNTESEITTAKYGIPQGGNLPPTLYIMYTNELLELKTHGDIYAYADDTCIIYASNNEQQIQKHIEEDIQKIEQWCINNLITIIEEKTEYMTFTRKTTTPNFTIKINNQNIKKVQSVKYLGLNIQHNLKWDKHIDTLTNKNNATIAALYKIKNYTPQRMKKSIYHSLFTSHISYLINIWGETTEKNINKIQTQQNKILKILNSLDKRTPSNELYLKTGELTIKQLIKHKNLLLLYKIENNIIQTKTKLKRNKQIHDHNTRRTSHTNGKK